MMLVPSALAAAALVGLTASGVLAASISVSGQQFVVTADELDGTGFSQYGGVIAPYGHGPTPVAVSVINSADLHSMCQSVTTPTPVGTFTIRLTAGTGGTPASASNLVVDASSLSGDATFSNIAIGQNATQLNGSGYPPPTAGGFGQMADSVVIKNLHQDTWYTTAGTFKLPGLSLKFGGSCP